MRRILIIADDLTGAAEIGGIAAEHGVCARIDFGGVYGVGDGAIAVDIDTRSFNATDAASRVGKILEEIDPKKFDLIYKKTDSVLRGPVAAEIEAIMKIVELRRCILVPQNPSRGRVIENGEYLVGGVPLNLTAFAADSEHPAATADVRKLVGGAAQYLRRNERPAAEGISIGEGANARDIDHWASCVDGEILPAGGADFFTAILQSRGMVSKPFAPIEKKAGKSLIIFGSASESSRKFVGEIAKPICAMPDALFDPVSRSRPARKGWVKDICEKLNEEGEAFVAIRREQMPERARYLREVVAAVVAETLENCEVANLFIEGGATAAAIVRWMGWREFEIVGHFGAGVVGFWNEKVPTPLIVIKPGSYAWPKNAF